MADSVVSVENISKKYILNHKGGAGDGFRHYLSHQLGAPLRALRRSNQGSSSDDAVSKNEEFWALRDVNFQVGSGEVVGIIGRNGAGKSTLLKVLSRISEPTTGRIELDGNVASLLEVGTGFHPDLTGRENIFLNGAILGMDRAAIKNKFDEIVEFAGVEKFLDTPVKRYSSGMYVRLAFSVAANLDSDILIVDEVLAVGDQEFQRKCLGKMESLSRGQGRTVLFVSHNMASVVHLCTRAIWMSAGTVKDDGLPAQIAAKYSALTSASGEGQFPMHDPETGVVVESASAQNLTEGVKQSIRFSIEVRFPFSVEKLGVGLRVDAQRQEEIVSLQPHITDFTIIKPGAHTVITFEFNDVNMTLTPGTYFLGIAMNERGKPYFFEAEKLIKFEVLSLPVSDAEARLDQRECGPVRIPLSLPDGSGNLVRLW